jgi:glycosyltransferase involved in cell wall biosynthesis
VHVIPSGVEPHLFAVAGARPLPELRGPRIVFVGRLTRAKGVETLLEAFARVRTNGAHLVYVGDGPDRARLERAIVERDLADRVRITGFVRHDEVPSHLAHADVLALPSAYEELGSILLEAMEAGVPLVASRTGGIPDLVDHGVNGLLVHPGAADQLAMAIDGVLGDEALASALRSGGRETVRSYRWDHLASRVLGVYRGCRSSLIGLGGASPRSTHRTLTESSSNA